jgi:hypothetical protein
LTTTSRPQVIPAGMSNELNKTNPKFLELNPTGE